MVSGVHSVCKKNYYVCIVSGNVETKTPEKELDMAFELIGPVLEKFTTVSQELRFCDLSLIFKRSLICMFLLLMSSRIMSL